MSGTTPTPASVVLAFDEMTAQIESAMAAHGLVACVEALCAKMSSFAQYRAVPSLTPILTADNLIWTLIRAYKTAVRAGQITGLEQHLQEVARTYLQSHPLPPKAEEPAKPVLPESPEVVVGGVDAKVKRPAKPLKKKAKGQDATPNAQAVVVDSSKQVRMLRGPMADETTQEDVKGHSKSKKTEGKGKKAKKVEGNEASSSKADPLSEGTIVVDLKQKKATRTRAQGPASRPIYPPAAAPPPTKRTLADTEGAEETPAKRHRTDLPAPSVPVAPSAPSAPRTARGKVESQRPAIAAASSTRLDPTPTNDDDEEYAASMDEDSEDDEEGRTVKRRRASTSTQQSGQVLRINLAANRKCERCTAVTGSPCILRFNIPIKPVKVVGDRVKLTCQDCRDKKQKCEWATMPPLPSEVPILRYDPIKKAEVKSKGKGKEKEKDDNDREHKGKGKGKGKRKETSKADTSDDSAEESDALAVAPRTAATSNELVLLQTIKKLEDELQATKKWVEEGPMKRITSLEKSLEDLKIEWQKLHNLGVSRSSEWVGKFTTFKKQYETHQKKVASKDAVDTLQTHFEFQGEIIARLRTRIENIEDVQKRLEEGINENALSPRLDASTRSVEAAIAKDNVQDSESNEGSESDVEGGLGARGGHGNVKAEEDDVQDTSDDDAESGNSDVDDEEEANANTTDIDHQGEADAEDGDLENKVHNGGDMGMGGDIGMDGAAGQTDDNDADNDDVDDDGDINMKKDDTTGSVAEIIAPGDTQVKDPGMASKPHQLVHYSDAEDMDIESPSPNVVAKGTVSAAPFAPSTPSAPAAPPPSSRSPLKVATAITPSSPSPPLTRLPVTTSTSHQKDEEALEW
ncbi:hypothetical protein D9613_012878 [Agrocybe pediades]|uniref:Uncharacterized protein n=1 Tax=Agrocybe pediades TaxID=84607 RepID=A0A8H4QVA5_9AGAR|nr:hypothetical protein D9613_012870 [Agrocybe pediades]KAF4618047.1 hypothetical protein D9613_012878 [Agrocybe pediades]